MMNTYYGGMNSFLLFHLVYYFDLIQNGKYRENDIQFLKYFLKYYAFEFENDKYSLQMNGIESKLVVKNNNNILSLETTLSNNDLGGKCTKYNEIKKIFGNAYNTINKCIENFEFSILNELGFQ